jgi:myo-inositol-1(or 4)-monophosphatase
MRDTAELIAIAQAATAIGSELITSGGPHEVRAKGDPDSVTDVDVRIEREIRAYLREHTPEIGFLGEEEGSRPGTADGECVWTLDPIDGTSNFVHGVPLCAVSLALVCEDCPLIAAVNVPWMRLRYTAAHGQGAFRDGTRLQASQTTELARAMVSIGDYAVGEHADQKNARRIRLTTLLAQNVERVRMFGSAAIDLVWVAEGRTDACIILSNKPWDTAGGALLAREAGALVLDANGDPHTLKSRETIAATPPIAELLVALVHGSR